MSSATAVTMIEIFPKDFFKYIVKHNSYKVAMYDSGCMFLNNLVFSVMEEINMQCAHRMNMTHEDLYKVLDDFFLESSSSSSNQSFKRHILEAGIGRVNEKEELAKDIPEMFSRISTTKTGMQFYLSAMMEVAHVCIQECNDRKVSCTEEHCKSGRFVPYIRSCKNTSIKTRGG